VDETIDHRQPWSHHAACPAGRLDRHAGRHERPTNPEYEPDGIHQEGGAASPGCDEPDPVTSRLAFSFLHF
jgi:hypothetical protein